MPTQSPTSAPDVLENLSETASSVVLGLPTFAVKLLLAVLSIFLCALAVRLGRIAIRRLVIRKSPARAQGQSDTLRSMITSVYEYTVYFVCITVILSIFGVNVSSLMAVAGVGGIALGFGAQTFVKDVISGIFLLLEGSIIVGDIVEINGLAGEVESIAIRTTKVRSAKGNQYVIPNGDIRTVVNMTRAYQMAIVDVRCPYEESVDRLVGILRDEMEICWRDIDGLTAAPDVLGVIAFNVDAMLIRVSATCAIKENWRIERELRRRIKERFDREGIVMPHVDRLPSA
jgi:small-conductance mechanosensitive channel